jgi:hypothetical protein
MDFLEWIIITIIILLYIVIFKKTLKMIDEDLKSYADKQEGD